GVSYRNQFTSSPSPYHTYYAEADVFINKWSSAFGAYILNTRAAGSQLIETGVGLSYMFNVKINEDLEFKPALQAIFHNKQRNFQSYTFPDRIDITGAIIPMVPQDYEPYSVNNIDFAAGAILQYRQLEFGFSAQHLGAQKNDNEPPTPFKALVHVKYIFNLNSNNSGTADPSLSNWYFFDEFKLIPYFQFTYQINYQYITGGVFVQSGALFAGGGVKTALKQGITNIALSGGFVSSSLRIGYSMDFIALGNKLKGWLGMSHEVFFHFSFGGKSTESNAKWKKYSTCACYL
ncbi:MAG: type IX secretion system membrane protein PorP/SprF, partial [Prevotellaceae bacterium]|nr:type IX secretion system membrane protein PorP/SprF [Prevotellaceae bacterium]